MRRLLLFVGLFVAVTCLGFLGVGAEGVYAQDAEPMDVEVPFLLQWMESAHADSEAEAFRHWDEDDPAEVPENCAKCHSSSGYQDFHGVDGSEAGVVNSPVPVDPSEVVDCVACHNGATMHKDSVVMPSGIELTGLGPEARCMECHQGRQSKIGVDAVIEELGLDDVDTVSEELGFQNIHYHAAAATKYGTLAKGGYEYDFDMYDGNFAHAEGFETCTDCHKQHTLELKLEACATCHEDVEAVEDLREVRMQGSMVDYDGDGDVDEGIYYELMGMQEMLYPAIQAYASEVAGTPIVYGDGYPYFFIDTDGDGEAADEEVNYGNKYNAWTPRLLKAAYNYQTSVKDHGAYAHGGKYIIQLLHDSIVDLNEAVAEPVDLSMVHRIDAGHFAGSEEAFRHWDEDGSVSGSCSKCHSSDGLPFFLEEGVNITQPIANGLECTTCHNDLVEFTIFEIEDVEFPSGSVVSAEEPKDNLCLNCHQGRQSTVSVNAHIGDAADDEAAEGLGFRNVHYFAAGATRFGSEVQGGYEYDGMEYAGYYDHANVNSCTDCHGTHSLQVDTESCIECHEEMEESEDIADIRYNFADYDGDSDDEEGVKGEIEELHAMLYEAMQAYAADEVGTGIVYDSHSYPYFFDEEEGRYSAWTPRLLRAAYNYQYIAKDPGAFTHNPYYAVQLLQDSLEDLGVDVSGMERP